MSKAYLLALFFLIALSFSVTADAAITCNKDSPPCVTKAQVDSDTKCLYIFDNKVYKSPSSSGHKSHTCGMTISTSLMPSSHKKDMANYLDDYLCAKFCTCTSNWVAGAWGACQPNGKRTRTVTDTNNCAPPTGTKPAAEESCTYTPPPPSASGTVAYLGDARTTSSEHVDKFGSSASITMLKEDINQIVSKSPTGKVNAAFMIGDFDKVSDTQKSWASSNIPTMPHYYVMGNHEIDDDDPSFVRNLYPYSSYGIPLNPGPAGTSKTTYSIDVGDIHVVNVNVYWDGKSNGNDVSGSGFIPDALYNWISADLTQTTKPCKVVMLHEPLYPGYNGKDRHVGDSLDANKANRDKLQQLFVDKKVSVLVAAHTHYSTVNNVDRAGKKIAIDAPGGVYHVDTGVTGPKTRDGEDSFASIFYTHTTTTSTGTNLILTWKRENPSWSTPKVTTYTSACSGTSPTPSCTDGIKNGLETDTDCGGPVCPACPADTTKPLITITCPPTAQTYDSNIISVSGTSSDNMGVSKVEVRVDSGVWQTVSGTTGWSLSGLNLGSAGTHTVTARATDTANPANTNTASITVTYTPDTPTGSYTYADIMAAIQPSLTQANKINPTNPMLQSQEMDGSVYIYKLPTNPIVYAYTSSASIDCDGKISQPALCDQDPSYLGDTSFHKANGDALDPVTLPWYVIPETPNPIFDYAKLNIAGGEVGLVIYPTTGKMNFGVFGDERGRDVGNAAGKAIGEVSYAMAVKLGIDPDPANGGVSSGVTYLVFTTPANVVSPIESISAAQTKGTSALNLMMSQLGAAPLTGTSKPPPVCTASPTTDTAPPTIVIKHPASGQSFSTQTIIFNGTASDESGVKTVQFRVNGGSWQLADGKESWSKSVKLTLLGSNKLEVNATDTLGNFAIKSVNAIYNDGTPPSVEISYPSQRYISTDQSITVNGKASDNFKLDKIYVQFQGRSWQSTIVSGTSTSKTWEKQLTLVRGVNTIIVMANDTSGNLAKDAVDVIYMPANCGNGIRDAGEVCDTRGNIGCTASKPVCSYCSKCIALPQSPKPFAFVNVSVQSAMRVGGQTETVINLENSFDEPDTYFLEFSSALGTSPELAYWSWFNGHRKDEQKTNTSITLGPRASGNVAIVTFGGAVKTGNLKIKVTSSNNGTSLSFSKPISITYGEEGISTETPEPGWTAYVLMALIGAILLI